MNKRQPNLVEKINSDSDPKAKGAIRTFNWLYRKLLPSKALIRRKIRIRSATTFRDIRELFSTYRFSAKTDLLPFTYLHAMKLAEFHFWDDTFETALFSAMVSFPIIVNFFLLNTIFRAFSYTPSWPILLVLHSLSFAALWAGIMILTMPLFMLMWVFDKDDLPHFAGTFSMGVLPLISAYYFIRHWFPPTPGNHIWLIGVISSSVFSSFVFYAGLIILASAYSIAAAFLRRRFRRRFPEAHIVGIYTEMMGALKKGRLDQAQMIGMLDGIANCMRSQLAMKHFTNDYQIDRELQNRLTARSNAIRKLKISLALHSSSFEKDLRDHIDDNFENAVKCDWDLFAESSDIPLTKGEKFAHLKHALKMVLIAVLPLLVISALEISPLKFQPRIPDSVIIGILVWTTLALFCAFDPDFTDRLGMFNDIFKFFSSIRNK